MSEACSSAGRVDEDKVKVERHITTRVVVFERLNERTIVDFHHHKTADKVNFKSLELIWQLLVNITGTKPVRNHI